jgi:hypothetical protein
MGVSEYNQALLAIVLTIVVIALFIFAIIVPISAYESNREKRDLITIRRIGNLRNSFEVRENEIGDLIEQIVDTERSEEGRKEIIEWYRQRQKSEDANFPTDLLRRLE